jgi:hypothetical protein
MSLLLLTKVCSEASLEFRGFIRTNEHDGPIPTLDEKLLERTREREAKDYQIFRSMTIVIVT